MSIGKLEFGMVGVWCGMEGLARTVGWKWEVGIKLCACGPCDWDQESSR